MRCAFLRPGGPVPFANLVFSSLLLAVLAGGGAAWAAETEDGAPAAAAAAGVPYAVAIEGVEESELADMLNRASQLVALEDEAPRTTSGLLRRISRDRERLLEVLHSEGFYGARIETALDQETAPVRVTISVETGPVYLLEEYTISYEPPAPARPLPDDLEDLGLHIGMPARAPEIDRARRDLVKRLGEIGHPQARIAQHRAVVDHGRKIMRVSVTADPGPVAAFGPFAIDGLEQVSERYVRNLVPWREGEVWDNRKIEAYRSALTQTGLFEGVAIDPGEAPDAAGRLPLTARLVEAKHRSVGAGARFSTDRGASVSAFWEHRNLLGENEILALSTELGQIEQSLGADFTKPDFRRLDQNLLINAVARRQKDDAFDEESVALFGGLERELGAWRVRGGPSFDYSILTDSDGTEHVALVGLPLSASRDATDDLLDPTEGTRLHLAATPYQGIGDPLNFLVLETSGSAYLSLDTGDRFVLAARGRVASILGEERADIPANKRLYSGGGGSVRGYPYRSLGPLDSENDPRGGRSVLELGLEMRVRITEDIGLVPFLEGGNAFTDEFPDSVSDLRWAAGLGARYYTAIGPLRLDVAVPLDRRPGVDDSFEVYVSIGQAF